MRDQSDGRLTLDSCCASYNRHSGVSESLHITSEGMGQVSRVDNGLGWYTSNIEAVGEGMCEHLQQRLV